MIKRLSHSVPLYSEPNMSELSMYSEKEYIPGSFVVTKVGNNVNIELAFMPASFEGHFVPDSGLSYLPESFPGRIRVTSARPLNRSTIVDGSFLINDTPINMTHVTVESEYLATINIRSALAYTGFPEGWYRITTAGIKYADGSPFIPPVWYGISSIDIGSYSKGDDSYFYKTKPRVYLSKYVVPKNQTLSQVKDKAGSQYRTLDVATIVTDGYVIYYDLYVNDHSFDIEFINLNRNSIHSRVNPRLYLTFTKELPSSLTGGIHNRVTIVSDLSNSTGTGQTATVVNGRFFDISLPVSANASGVHHITFNGSGCFSKDGEYFRYNTPVAVSSWYARTNNIEHLYGGSGVSTGVIVTGGGGGGGSVVMWDLGSITDTVCSVFNFGSIT